MEGKREGHKDTTRQEWSRQEMKGASAKLVGVEMINMVWVCDMF